MNLTRPTMSDIIQAVKKEDWDTIQQSLLYLAKISDPDFVTLYREVLFRCYSNKEYAIIKKILDVMEENIHDGIDVSGQTGKLFREFRHVRTVIG